MNKFYGEKRRAYRLIISDDEDKICTLIKNSIHWEELNLELCGICHNGLELRDKVWQEHPDIILIDICMPGINGINLIRELREMGSKVKILIVSGYRQFEYAREALKYGVDNYLLKPIDENELNGALEKICIQMEIEQNNVYSKSEDKIKDTLQSFFVQDVKNGMISAENMNLSDINRKYSSHFEPGVFRVLFVKIDIWDDNTEKADLQLIQRKIRERCMMIVEKFHIDTIVSYVQNSVVFTVNYAEENDSRIRRTAKEFLENSLEIVSFFKGIGITVGMGRKYENAAGIEISYKEAEEALIFRIRSRMNKVYAAEELVVHRRKSYLTERMKADILKSFETGDGDMFREHIKRLIYDNVTDIYLLYCALEECVLLFFAFAEDQEIDKTDKALEERKLLYEMQQAISVASLTKTVEEGVIHLLAKVEEERRQREDRPIREAKEYVKKHYAEKIRLEDVAGEMGFNTAYFSALFSEKAGINFTDYVNNYRIEMAKELLRSGGHTVAEICDMVGVSNQRYFSKLFKTKVGVKPTEYRNLYN
ncbi:MAG: response regulator [Eubacteriales bacterium]|nr:response regulator [Eubacteriales bacterium]